MYAYRYLNRHYFLENEGRLYLVDTGCPKSFAINGTVPWVDKTPAAVILDMTTGVIRFHRLENEFFRARGRVQFVPAPATRAPIIQAYCAGKAFKVLWDTGAQLGYAVGLLELLGIQRDARAPMDDESRIEAMGPFDDESPIYGKIRSENTWKMHYEIPPIADHDQGVLTIVTQMADAPPRIAQDLLKEGAEAVLGNDWMHRDTTIIAIKGKRSEIHIKGRGHLFESTEHFRVFEDPPRSWRMRRRFNPLDILDEDEPASTQVPWDEELERLPVGAEATGVRPMLRPVPSQLGAFTVEALRAHLKMNNIDGLIGNDLLMDTLL